MLSKVFLLLLGWGRLAGALPHEYVLSNEQQAYTLPPEKREEITQLLKSISWLEKDLGAQPSLLFTSGQSLSGESLEKGAKRVLNRIQLFERGRYDIWLMKQAVAGRGFDFKSWNRVLIVMDRSDHHAYYFQFGMETPGETRMPMKAYTAACLTCHSSGPRAIRPEASRYTQALTQDQFRQIDLWNERIKSYREVTDFNPQIAGRSMVEWNQPGDHDELKIEACIECHAEGSGVRGPLRRQNAESIWYLVQHGNMPREGRKLSVEDLKCLRRWLDREEATGDCTTSGEPKRKSLALRLLERFGI